MGSSKLLKGAVYRHSPARNFAEGVHFIFHFQGVGVGHGRRLSPSPQNIFEFVFPVTAHSVAFCMHNACNGAI